jgi:hypothetical protein
MAARRSLLYPFNGFISSRYATAKQTFLGEDLREMQKRYKNPSPSVAFAVAEDYALLGEQNKALEWLQNGPKDSMKRT